MQRKKFMMLLNTDNLIPVWNVKASLRTHSLFLITFDLFFQFRKRYLKRRKWLFMKQPQKFSFLFKLFVLMEHKIFSRSRREKTSGKFALTKAVSCLPTTLTYIIYVQGRQRCLKCYSYDILTQSMNSNANRSILTFHYLFRFIRVCVWHLWICTKHLNRIHFELTTEF